MLALLLFLVAQDPLGPAFERDLAARAGAKCGAEFRVALGTADPVGRVRRFTGGEEGKELYVQFLKDRHGYAIARVNELYGTDVASFTELLTHGFAGLNRAAAEVRADDAAFLEEMTGRWRSVVARACRADFALTLEGEELVVIFRPPAREKGTGQPR